MVSLAGRASPGIAVRSPVGPPQARRPSAAVTIAAGRRPLSCEKKQVQAKQTSHSGFCVDVRFPGAWLEELSSLSVVVCCLDIQQRVK